MKLRDLLTLVVFSSLSLGLIGQKDYSENMRKYNKSNDINEKILLLYSFHHTLSELEEDTAFYYVKDIHYEGINHRRKDAIALSNLILSLYFRKYSYYKEAEEKLNKALQYYKTVEDDTMLVLSHNSLGNIYYSQGDIGSAKKEYEKAIYFGKQSRIEKFEMLPVINLARIAINNEDYVLSEELLESYIRYHHSPEGIIRELASAYGLLGEHYLSQEKYKEACDQFLRSMEYGLTIRSLMTIANAYTNLGITEFFAENFNRSKEYFRLALEIRVEDGDLLQIAEAYYNLGDYFTGVNRLDSAIVNYKKCVEVANEAGALITKKDGLEQIGSIYENYGKKDEYIAVLKQIIETQDAISAKQRKDDNTLMSFNYEQTMLELEGVNELREGDLEGKVKSYQSIFNNWLLVSVGGILFLGIVFYIQRRKNKENK